MHLTREQIGAIVAKLGQPRASVTITAFLNALRPALDSAEVGELYDETYRARIQATPLHELVDGRFRVHVYNRYTFAHVLAGRRGAAVLDVGCGDGEFALALASRGCACTGVDRSAEFVARAARRAAECGLPARFLQADVAELAARGEGGATFDFVVLNDVAEHLSDRELAPLLAATRALLAPGGELLLHTPNGLALCCGTDRTAASRLFEAWLGATQGYRGFERSMEQLYYEQTHINVKSWRQWRGFLRGHGFAARVRYDEPPAGLRDLVLRAVSSSNMLVIAHVPR